MGWIEDRVEFITSAGAMAAIFLISASEWHEYCLGDGNAVADASTVSHACGADASTGERAADAGGKSGCSGAGA
jgi:hypothetical protein